MTDSKDAKTAKDGQPVKEDTVGPKSVLATIISKVKPKNFKVEAKSPIKETELSEDEVLKLIAADPKMSASTFYNLLKSKGAKIVGLTSSESDTASANIAALRAGHAANQEDSKKESGNLNSMSFRFLEAVSGDVKNVDGTPQNNVVGFTKFKAVLLEEGMGNMRDAYFYSRQALESAVPVFEGAKIYADHPSKIDEATRPERTVRDILGHFENVHIEEGDQGQALLVGEVSILADDSYRWARSLMEHAVAFSKKYPDKEFIGLSINANGDAEAIDINKLIEMGVPDSVLPKIKLASEQGITQLKLVKNITSAVSCDMVTEAGAKGRVLQLLENEQGVGSMDDKKTADQADPSKLAAEADAVPAHDDAAQDAELIKAMIKKHMGDDAEASEEECGVVKEAYEACKEMGMEASEAEEKAVHALKLAKHMASKKQESMAKEAEEAKAKEAEEAKKKLEAEAEEKHKEAWIAIKAENAKLKEALVKVEIEKEIEKICMESKMSRPLTKAFREAVGTPKSLDEVKKAWKIFEAGIKNKDTALDAIGFSLPEKQTLTEGSKFDFSGVLKD